MGKTEIFRVVDSLGNWEWERSWGPENFYCYYTIIIGFVLYCSKDAI